MATSNIAATTTITIVNIISYISDVTAMSINIHGWTS